jgi:exosortase/archaeosortase family protein
MKKQNKQKKGSGSVVQHKSPETVSIKRFILTYVVLMGIFFFMMGFAPLHRYIDVDNAYSKGIVFLTHFILNLMHIQGSYYGTIINLSGISLDVMFGCNGLEAVMIYAVAVVAFPATWKKRIIGIVAGCIVIQIINILRIVGLAYSALHYRELFKTIHIYVAQGIMIAVALGMFFVYLHYARKEKRETP